MTSYRGEPTQPTTAAGRALCRDLGDEGVIVAGVKDSHLVYVIDRILAIEAEARQQDSSALVRLMENEGVVEWGDERHRERFLAALPPSVPPALDVDRLRDALLNADRAIGIVAESDAEIDHYTAMAIAVAAEYTRQEQDR